MTLHNQYVKWKILCPSITNMFREKPNYAVPININTMVVMTFVFNLTQTRRNILHIKYTYSNIYWDLVLFSFLMIITRIASCFQSWLPIYKKKKSPILSMAVRGTPYNRVSNRVDFFFKLTMQQTNVSGMPEKREQRGKLLSRKICSWG